MLEGMDPTNSRVRSQEIRWLENMETVHSRYGDLNQLAKGVCECCTPCLFADELKVQSRCKAIQKVTREYAASGRRQRDN